MYMGILCSSTSSGHCQSGCFLVNTEYQYTATGLEAGARTEVKIEVQNTYKLKTEGTKTWLSLPYIFYEDTYPMPPESEYQHFKFGGHCHFPPEFRT